MFEYEAVIQGRPVHLIRFTLSAHGNNSCFKVSKIEVCEIHKSSVLGNAQDWTESSIMICPAFHSCNFTDKILPTIIIDVLRSKPIYSKTRIKFSVSLSNYLIFLLPEKRVNNTWRFFFFTYHI